MGLLALLGETQVQAEVLTDGSEVNSSVGALATVHVPQVPHTADSWQTTVLLYNSRDNQTSSTADIITLRLTGLPQRKGLMYVTHYMDNNVTNPFKLWENMGSPDYPTAQQFTQLRSQEDPQTDGPLPVPSDGSLTLKAVLPVPSVLLVHVCAQSKEVPNQVNGVRFITITKGQVLIIWKDHCIGTKCIKTYEVELSKDETAFQRINHRDTIFTHYTYSPESLEASGYYRVRVVDYWGRNGEYSVIEKYSEN